MRGRTHKQDTSPAGSYGASHAGGPWYMPWGCGVWYSRGWQYGCAMLFTLSPLFVWFGVSAKLDVGESCFEINKCYFCFH